MSASDPCVIITIRFSGGNSHHLPKVSGGIVPVYGMEGSTYDSFVLKPGMTPGQTSLIQQKTYSTLLCRRDER